MSDKITSDDVRDDHSDGRRDFLRAIAATGIGLAAVPTASAFQPSQTNSRATISSTALWFDGFEHRAMGEAVLDDSEGPLVVSELGSGDGVVTTVGEATSFGTRSTFDAEREPGETLQFQGFGVLDGQAGQPVGSLDVTRIDDTGRSFRPDFSPIGSESYQLDVYNDGELVHSGNEFTDPTVLYPPDSPSVDYEFEVEWVWTGAGWKLIIRVVIDLPVVDPDDLEAEGDEIHLTPESPGIEAGPVTDVATIADGPAEFTIPGESVGVHGHDYRQRGDSRLFPYENGTELGLETPGSADGVTVELDDAATFGMTFEPFDLQLEGRTVTTSSRGTVEEEPDVPLGTATLAGDGDGILVNADFTSVGADGVRVIVYDGEEKSGETEVGAGEIGYFEDGGLFDWCGTPHPPEWPFPPWPPEPPRPPCPPMLDFGLDGSPVPIPFHAADGSEFVGDQIRLQAIGGAEMSGLSEFGLATESIEQLNVHDALSR